MKKLIALVTLAISFNATASGWAFEKYVDPITDEVGEVYLKEPSEKKNKHEQILFMIGCIDNKIDMILGMKHFFSIKEGQKVIYRFDKGEVHRKIWNVKKNTVYPINGSEAKGFFQNMLKSYKVHFRINDNDMAFDLRGLQAFAKKNPLPCL